jgi:SAM-dependent methyltransferase
MKHRFLDYLFSNSVKRSDDLSLETASERYAHWISKLKKADLFPIEHLLPTLETSCPNGIPALMAHGATISIGDEEQLKADIRLLSPWGYGIQLRPGVATANADVAIQRMTYRSHLISDTVRNILGSEFGSTTFLDMACNHGYFALEAAFHGAQHVLGVDLRPENIAKANFLKGYFQVNRVEFRVQDVYELDTSSKFDVVYNLGLFYHVTDPYRLMQHTYSVCGKIAVVDSIMHKEPVSAFIQRLNKDTASHAEGAYAVELHPTYRAMIDLMHAVGFKDVTEVTAKKGESKIPHELYDRYDRRCLIGFK